MSILLETKNLTKKFGKTLALAGIDLQIESGRIVGLLGPNGSGKTTLIKLANGLLTPTNGELLVAGKQIGVETKKVVAYLPDKNYLNDWMRVADLVQFFSDFYLDFQVTAAEEMLANLQIDKNTRLKALSKGTKEKVQLILVMSRKAQLYLLDEPIAGVDPAARDYILNTILTNYNPEAAVIISTHLIADIEQILDEVIFINKGKITLHSMVDVIRAEKNMSVDALFREEFKC